MNTFNNIPSLFYIISTLYGFTIKCLFSDFINYPSIFILEVLFGSYTLLLELFVIVETIIFKIVPCFLIIFSFIIFTLCNNLEFNIGTNLYYFISLLFFLSNIFTIHLTLASEKSSSNYWKTIKTLFNNPILLGQVFVLIIMMYILRNLIISNAVPMDSRSIIVIFYVVISLLPLTSLYFTIIRVTLKFNRASVLNLHKIYYNNCEKSINGPIILYIFIYMIIIRLIYVAFAINFDIGNYGIFSVIVCNLTYIGTVFMENYNNDFYDYSSFEYNTGFQNFEPNTPNPGPQGPEIPLLSDGEDNNDRLKDIQETQRTLSCVSNDAKDLEDMEHRDSTFYCKLGIAKIKENILSKNVDTTLEKIVHQMTLRNITCKNLFNILPLQENNIVLKKHPINLISANNDQAVYKLAIKTANLISSEIIGKNVKIIFGHNRFKDLSLWDWSVKVNDIWHQLTTQEKELFKNCVIANRTYYNPIRVKGSAEIDLHANLSSPKTGFTIPNHINKYGLGKAFSNNTSGSITKGLVKQPKSLFIDEFERNNNHAEHEKVESVWFCSQGYQRLHDISTTQNIDIDTLRSRLFYAGVKCKYLLKQRSVLADSIEKGVNTLDLSKPHRNIEVFYLAKKLATLSIEVVESRYAIVRFSKNSYSSIALPSWKVVYSEISSKLTLPEKELLVKCIKINKSYYKFLEIENDNLTPSSAIMADKGGFKTINNINEFGDLRQRNIRGAFKKAALKRTQEEANLEDRAESSKSNKLS